MPVYSMTGVGSATQGAATEGNDGDGAGSVTVDIRSVNGRFLDLALRLPDEFRSLEPALRELVSATLHRGKVELRLNVQRVADTGLPQPSADQLSQLARLEPAVQVWLPQAAPLSVHEVLQWCRGSAPEARLDDAALAAAKQALNALEDARAREGARLASVLQERVQHLRTLVAQARPLVPAIVSRQQQRFLDRWHEALSQAATSHAVPREALEERALTEAATFAIRIDVAEELARLLAHLDEIERLLTRGGELGKRLDFLIQELHRESNTLGSKSTALELTAIALDMKVAVEQMREQVQNIE